MASSDPLIEDGAVGSNPTAPQEMLAVEMIANSSAEGNGVGSRPIFGDVVATSYRPTAVAEPSPAEQAIDFLKAIDATGRHNLVRMCPDKTHLPVGQTFEPGAWGKIEDFIEEWDDRENLYFSVNEPRPGAPNKKLEAEDIGAVRAVVADVDLPGPNSTDNLTALWSTVSAKLQSGPAPTVAVDSGGGVQATWVLKTKRPVDADVASATKAQCRGLQVALDGDAVNDLPRVMRLPGPMNLPTAEKRAKGRTPRRSSILSIGDAVTMEALASGFPPLAALPESPDSDARVAAVQLELERSHAFGARFYEDVDPETRQAFEALCLRNAAVAALWSGDRPRSGDASGSGYRAALAAELGRTGEFTAVGYAELCGAWPHAVQAGHDPEEKLTARALARDWARIAEPASPQAMVDRWFEPINDNHPLAPGVTARTGKPPATYEVLSINQLFQRPDPTFMLERHIPEASFGFLYGEPGTGKSFIALDWALHIAFGRPTWHGDKISVPDDAGVIYIAAEGASGFKTRVRAWMQAHGIADSQRARFGLIFQSVNFMAKDDVARLTATLRNRVAGNTCLLVVDTVSRAMPGADENLQKEMTLFVDACQSYQREFGATVLGVHHANRKGDMRGSGVLGGAGDFVFKLERKSGAVIATLRCEKQKDAPDGWSENYRLDAVHVDAEQSSLVPFRCETTATAGLSPDVSDRILQAIEAAWIAGNPWSAVHQAKSRYAVNYMCRDFGLDPDGAKSLLSSWLGMGLLENIEFSAKDHTKGLRVCRNVQDFSAEGDNLSTAEVEDVFV